MENYEDMRVISLRELWEILTKHLLVIALAAVLAVVVAFVGVKITYEPMYESTATLYILRQGDENMSSGDASTDFSLALKVVNDCTYLLKSHTVLNETISDLKLDMSYRDLYKAVSTSNPENSRILEVTVQADSPEKAKRIVDHICELGKEQIAAAMGFEQVNLFEYGVLDQNPCNGISILTYGLVGVVAAVAAYAVFLLIFLLDDTIRSGEDIERHLGLSILGEIPDIKEAAKKRSGYYRGEEQNRKLKKGNEQ